MKKLLIYLLVVGSIITSCTENSDSHNLAEKYGLSDKILKSNQFKEFMEVGKISMIKNAEASDNYMKVISKNQSKLQSLEEVINQETKKGNVQRSELEKIYINHIGASPFDSSLDELLKEKREALYLAFPNLNNSDNHERMIEYLENEIMMKDSSWRDRQKKLEIEN